jgi:hypothetical protein
MGTGAAHDTMISNPMRTSMMKRLAFRVQPLECVPQPFAGQGVAAKRADGRKVSL